MGEPIEPEIHFYENLDSASKALAEKLQKAIQEITKEKDRFTLALAGGNTPKHLYNLLVKHYSSQLPWSLIHLFWGDERYVLKDHPESNYNMAFNTIIAKAPIPPQNVHRIPTEIKPPEKAAEAYEIQLREFFSTTASYTFDLILLGMGEDGHTASLFPKSPVLQENKKWVTAVSAPPLILPNTRITLTLPIINKAKSIFFLVAGSKKIRIVKSILNDYKKAAKHYPAAMVQPKHRLIWFIAN